MLSGYFCLSLSGSKVILSDAAYCFLCPDVLIIVSEPLAKALAMQQMRSQIQASVLLDLRAVYNILIERQLYLWQSLLANASIPRVPS